MAKDSSATGINHVQAGSVKENRSLWACLFAFGAAGLYWFVVLVLGRNWEYGVNIQGNWKVYAIFLLIFSVVSCASYPFLRKLGERQLNNSIKRLAVGIGVFSLVFIVFLHSCPLFSLPGWISGPMLNLPGWFIFITLILLGISVFLLSLNSNTEDGNQLVSKCLIIISSLIWAIAVYSPNPYSQIGGSDILYNTYHSSAYLDSIYNVYYHIPFIGDSEYQYGHYGLLFYIPLKIFGGNMKTIAVLLSVLSFISAFMLLSALSRVIRNQFIKVVVIVLSSLVGISAAFYNIYWQIYPHRMIFPSLLIYIVTVLCERGFSRKWYWIGAAFLIVSFIWNTETGIICAAVWCPLILMDYMRRRGRTLKSFLLGAAIAGGTLTISFFASLGIVSLYNVLCNGNAVGGSEYFGLVNPEFMKALASKLYPFSKDYSFKLFTFLVCLFWSIRDFFLEPEEKGAGKFGFLFANAIIGLGLMTYYINRTIAGCLLNNIHYICCLGVLLEGTFERLKRNPKNQGAIHAPNRKGLVMNRAGKMLPFRVKSVYETTCLMLGLFSALMLSISILNSMNNFSAMTQKVSSEATDYDSLKEYAKEIASYIGDDTYSTGLGSSTLFFEIGKDKGGHQFYAMDVGEAQKHDAILLMKYHYDWVPDGYKMEKEFKYRDTAFGYFTKQK